MGPQAGNLRLREQELLPSEKGAVAGPTSMNHTDAGVQRRVLTKHRLLDFCAGKDVEQKSRAQDPEHAGPRGRGCRPGRDPLIPGAPSSGPDRPSGEHTTSPDALVAATTGGPETPTCRANGPLRARTGRRRLGPGGAGRSERRGSRRWEGGQGAVRRGRCFWEQLRAPRWESDAGASTSWKAALNSPRFQPVPLEKFPSSSATTHICRAEAMPGCSSGPILGGQLALWAGETEVPGRRRAWTTPSRAEVQSRAGEVVVVVVWAGAAALHLAHSWAPAAGGHRHV